MSIFFQVKNITHFFEDFMVLKEISFSVKREEILAIVGPVGCGKTTLLKIIAGLIKPTKGEISTNYPMIVDFVFQKNNLFPWKTVQENIALPLKIQRISKTKISKKTDKIIKMVGLENFKNNYPFQISGGMEQLTALARAFISKSNLLLLDEPFAHLDFLTRQKMNRQLLKLWEKKKKTIIFVSHSIEEAVFLANKVLILTSSPAKIKNVVKINFPYPRKPHLFSSSLFVSLCQKIKKINKK